MDNERLTPEYPRLIQIEDARVRSENRNLRLTSRSAIECHQRCQRKRWLEYFYKGVGIRPKRKNVPLLSGNVVHLGVGFILDWWLSRARTADNMLTTEEIANVLEKAVDTAKAAYITGVKETGLLDIGAQTPDTQAFVQAEQLALCEALIRVWALVEFPMLVKYYDILATEQEMLIDLGGNIILQARVDAILVSKPIPGDQSRHIFNYQLKTAKDFYYKLEKSYQIDLQTLTETLATNLYFQDKWGKVNKDRDDFLRLAAKYITTETTVDKLATLADKYFLQLPSEVSGTKFCFLIKGPSKATKDEDPRKSGRYTDNTLIRAYRNIGISTISYAHSFYFPNASNPSGQGRLGKGWEAFNVWEDYPGGVAAWITALVEGKIQREAGYGIELLRKWVVTPPEYFRDKSEIDQAIDEITYQEVDVFYKHATERVDDLFPVSFGANANSCYWASTTECSFIPICHGKEWYTGKGVPPEVREDPINSGWYEARVSHHALEAELDGEE